MLTVFFHDELYIILTWYYIARGKTHISRRLGRYLQFFHAMPVEIYNFAEYRRERYGAISEAEWFDNNNSAANDIRDVCLKAVLDDSMKFLNENSSGVAIIDATNATFLRRKEVSRQVRYIGFSNLAIVFFKLAFCSDQYCTLALPFHSISTHTICSMPLLAVLLLCILTPKQLLASQIRSTGAKILWIEVMNEDEEFLIKQYHSTATNSPDFAGCCDADAVSLYCIFVVPNGKTIVYIFTCGGTYLYDWFFLRGRGVI